VDVCNRIDYVANDWHRLVDKLAIFIHRCCAFFLFSEKFGFSRVQIFCCWACERCKHLRKRKQTMLLLRWSNNNVIHGSQRRYFIHKTKAVRLEKRELCSRWVSLAKSEARSSKWRPQRPRLQKQRFPKFTAMWKKRCDTCKKKSVRCNRKATFHYKGKLQDVFRAGLNEIKYDYVDSKQHFYL